MGSAYAESTMVAAEECAAYSCATTIASPHVLLLPLSAQGHVTPLMELAKHLSARGVEVTFATEQNIHARLLRSWQSHSLIHLRCIPDLLPSESNQESPDDPFKALEGGAFELLRILKSEGRPVTCIVGDFFLGWTSSLARRASIPDWVFWPMNASVLTMYLDLQSLMSSGYDPFNEYESICASRERLHSKTINFVADLPLGLTIADFPGKTPFGKPLSGWLKEVLMRCFSRLAEAKLGVLCNTTMALEQSVLQALHSRLQNGEFRDHTGFIQMIGPLVANAVADQKTSGTGLWEEEREECEEWLDNQPPTSVLYVAFGSLRVLTAPQLQELLLGLIASGHRFLMVLRPNTVVSEAHYKSHSHIDAQDTDVVPLEKALPAGFLSRDQQHLYKIVSWAPQSLVLAHPSIGGFFSHCGWNSTLESLCCGVPILGWPWIMDQVTNCRLVSSVWKVGLLLGCNERGETSRDQVESGVRRLKEGAVADTLRARAREIRDKMREIIVNNQPIMRFIEEIEGLSCLRP
ncbi:hypothetical protein KP509_01G081200 [Ceratopteris richardii]|uniref:Glycosyltransferase n=1 Tax=Ceratopteris richardii TaxID=49495 RepID=A0A8T2VLB6_CERRI|nr:hypothetical protein KP509_01G081200 [Ceratopteris richardii]KAH7446904.1 hypothetical protein KP509_01G081200 [Ceratopteris richardii]